MNLVEKTTNIRIKTLEEKSGIFIEDWIRDWIEDGESFEVVSSTEVLIGDNGYIPLKWKCPVCGRWNYELHFEDPAGAMVVCNACHEDSEL